ncbi:MAG TPA: LamG-like jellyroll fold domain-containing protein [Planctomycetota bacterium]
MRVAIPLLALLAASATAAPARAPHLRRHPSNPRYFEFRGQPAVLVTSAEHYGAVLNLDFDYVPYLNELAAKGLNNTRMFSGAYVEIPGAFGIQKNTLAPAAGRYLAPWARSATPGYKGGGNKFDLNAWDAAYFARLRDFVAQAGQRGIVVEVNLFCPFYDDNLWTYSPMNAQNNVNGVGNFGKDTVYTLGNGPLLARQDAMVQKFVAELRDYDNVYYEVCNEPYAGNVTMDWQNHVVSTIVQAESGFANRHLISLNIANGSAAVTNPNPDVDILNFHYADPPTAVAVNYGLGRIIGENETGFDGSSDYEYRKEGWHFIVAGGALYNNLDYSFTAALENGTDTQSAPGGGGPALRSQLKILKDFIHGFNFLAMAPDNGALQGGVPSGATARCLAQAGEQYALYLSGAGTQANLVLNLPAANYRAEWVNTKTGAVDKAEDVAHGGGSRTLASPAYTQDIALRVRRTSGGAPSHPPANATFYRAINLNGPALTINGNAWEGAAAPNYSYTGSAFSNQAVALSPPTDGNRATMIRSSVWNPNGSSVAMSGVPSGRYVVYLYVWEDNFSQTYSVSLEGAVVQANYASGAGGHWDRLGPWTRDILDGTVNVSCSAGDANLSGLEVWRENASTTVSVTASDASAGEPSNPGAFTVSRTGSTSSALTVGYTVGGSATPGSDYQALSGSVTIAAGAASAVVPVNVLNDAAVESSETVTLSVPGSSATVTIADDDVAPPPTTGDLLVHLQFDAGSGTVAIDASGNGNPGELRNGASWAAGKSGSAASLEGTDDHVRVASSASLDAASGSLTVAAWVYRASNQGGWRVVATRQYGSSWDDQYTLGFLDNGYRFGVHTTSGYPMLAGGTAPVGQWIHMAGTYDGGMARLYVNGAQVAASAAGGAVVADGKPLLIGAGQNDGTSAVQEALAGRIDDLRLYKRALSAAEIQAIAVPPASSSGLVLHWPFDGNANDASGNGNTGTPRGAVFTTGNLGGGLDCDGDHLDAPSTTSINNLGGQMSVALWIYKRADAPNYGSVIGRRLGASFDDLWILYYNNTANDEYAFGVSTTSGTAHLVGPSSAGDLNRWVHLAAVYDGATMRIYRDGVEIASRGQTGAVLTESTPIVLGAGDNGSISEHVNGIFDDVRLYSRALSAADVQGLYTMSGAVARVAAASELADTGSGKDACGLLGLEALLLILTLRARGSRAGGACAGRR